MNTTPQEPDAGESLLPVPANKLGLGGDLTEMVQVAQLMAKARVALPEHLHNSPGECLAIVMLARDWNMNPFAVGQKTSIISKRLMYEGQLVQAAINKSGILAERFNYEFVGEGEKLTCKATARIKGDKEAKSVTIGMPKATEARNSPLWKSDPEQQLSYKATRIWARRFAPEIMLGVYTPEDDWTDREPMSVAEPGAVNNRLAALTSQPGEPMNVIEGSAAKHDPFAEGAVISTAKPTLDQIETATKIFTDNDVRLEDLAPGDQERLEAEVAAADRGRGYRCDECGNEGIDGGCPSCGTIPNGE